MKIVRFAISSMISMFLEDRWAALSAGNNSRILYTLSIKEDWYLVAIGMIWFIVRSPNTRASIWIFFVYISHLTSLRASSSLRVMTPWFEHADTAIFQISVEDQRHAGLAIQAPACGLGLPFLAVAIAVEMDRLAFLDILADYLDDSGELIPFRWLS